MSGLGDHYSLAVAVFADHPALCDALAALMQGGIGLEQVCVVAEAATMDEWAEVEARASCDAAVVSMLRTPQIWPVRSRNGAPIAAAGRLAHVLQQIERSSAASPPGVRLVRGFPDLSEHWQHGLVTLVVRALTPAQRSVATRTLLDCSTQRVKTFEFNLDAP